MLVLSRRLNEKILFPTLGIAVEVCNITRNAVRLGIEAPPAVPIVREEIATEADKSRGVESKSLSHQMRNRLHLARLAVHLAQKQVHAGLVKEAEATLNDAVRDFESLERELGAPKPEVTNTSRSIRALLVDDNFNESSLLAEFLRLHGVTVETAGDGQAALEYLKSHDRPDVVLLDMRMPRCDGPSTVAAIRSNADYRGLKLFAVTGVQPQECTLPQDERGVDGWFTKPLNPIKLIDAMKLALCRN